MIAQTETVEAQNACLVVMLYDCIVLNLYVYVSSFASALKLAAQRCKNLKVELK